MKPLNLDNRPCSPISSNCVVWQGPTLDCINLCTGDTISDVVAKLATELCTLLDQTNVTNYDLTCLGITACGPANFQALIQLLINKICELQGLPTDTIKTSDCPDCIVDIADCFRTGGNTTMQLLDYVQMIGEKICSLIDEIASINIQITNLDNRVTILENTPPPVFTLPSIIVDCTLSGTIIGGNSYTIDLVLNALVNDNTYGYCELLGSTGLPSELLSAVASQCITSVDVTLSNPPATYGSLATWVGTPVNVADAINNLWLVVCDIYNASPTFAVTDTNTVNLTVTGGVIQADVQDTGWVNLEGFAYIPSNNIQGQPQVRRIGNVLHFRGTVIIPLDVAGAALQWSYVSNTDSYFLRTEVQPFQGPGGVYCNPNGSVVFNYTGIGTSCNSVIPTSVLPPGFVVDGQYQNPAGWKIASRIIPINSSNSTFLSTLFSQVITSNGNLVLGLIKDQEASWVSGRGGNNSFDTSHLNTLISHVTTGDYVPKYSSANTTLYNNTASGVQGVDIDFPTGYTYPFSCNANDEQEVGGFFQRLDGLTAFISPCADLIPTPTPCE